jgi:DtxR family Mn-dependent transcriptional regulator
MYLKSILLLDPDVRPVRVKDVADAMGVTMASATEAIGTLRKKGLVLHDSYGDVRFAARGRKAAGRVLHRFEVLRRFLTQVLGIADPVARRDACEIEHVVSAETMERLTAFLDYVATCRHDVPAVIAHFQRYFELRSAGNPCDECEMEQASRGADQTETC